MISEDKLIHFSGVAMGQTCTIVLRGPTYLLLFLFIYLKPISSVLLHSQTFYC